jgi:hypothetical protein
MSLVTGDSLLPTVDGLQISVDNDASALLTSGAFFDYLDLRLAVSEHVGSRAITDVFPRLVRLAEATLNKKLRTRKQMTTATLTFANGVAPLPTNLLEIISLFGPNGEPMRATSLADVQFPRSSYGQYAIDGVNVIIYGLTGTRNLRYFAALPTLTIGPTTSNWLLADHPHVYLYAVGFEAAKFLRDPELAAMTDQLFSNALDEIKIDDDRSRWANGVVRMQAATP